jgi:hypothetical protein
MQTMIEKLELIAQCLRDSRVIEFHGADGIWKKSDYLPDQSGNVSVTKGLTYRAKPVKPRVSSVLPEHLGATVTRPPSKSYYMAVELTPEVRAALDAAGVDYE